MAVGFTARQLTRRRARRGDLARRARSRIRQLYRLEQRLKDTEERLEVMEGLLAAANESLGVQAEIHARLDAGCPGVEGTPSESQSQPEQRQV